ncbi:hypothetical protein ACKGJO_06820 [Gracilimonas sp. Q87]|uniref:hypothetical protein n=1 Tax=Gracilimonas sp. Q87 TaxID=3384766 RepID=UPI0039844EB3
MQSIKIEITTEDIKNKARQVGWNITEGQAMDILSAINNNAFPQHKEEIEESVHYYMIDVIESQLETKRRKITKIVESEMIETPVKTQAFVENIVGRVMEEV